MLKENTFFVSIELENQAKKDLKKYLAKDGINVEIYKEKKSDPYRNTL